MTIRKANPLWMWLVLLGLVLRVETDILDPIHEQMHAEAVRLTGGIVTDRGQSYVTFVNSSWAALVWWAGYTGEVVLYGSLALVLRRAGPFALGVFIPLLAWAPGSTDFSHLGSAAHVLFVLLWVAYAIPILRVYYSRYVHTGAGSRPSSAPQANSFRAQWARELERYRKGY